MAHAASTAAAAAAATAARTTWQAEQHARNMGQNKRRRRKGQTEGTGSDRPTAVQIFVKLDTKQKNFTERIWMNRKANNANARHAGMRRRRRPRSGPTPGPTPAPAPSFGSSWRRGRDGDEAANQTQQIARQTPKSFCTTKQRCDSEGRTAEGQAGERGREIDSGTVAPSVQTSDECHEPINWPALSVLYYLP